MLQDKLIKIHEKETKLFLTKHGRQMFDESDTVWINMNEVGIDKTANKFSRVGMGPS